MKLKLSVQNLFFWFEFRIKTLDLTAPLSICVIFRGNGRLQSIVALP